MKRHFISICTAALALTSCQKFLDIKPKGTYIPVTVTDYDNLLNNSNSMEFNFQDNNRGCNFSYLTDNLEMSEAQAQAGFILASHPNIDRYYSYIFRHPYRNPEGTDYFWGSGSLGVYAQVSYFNNAIEGIRSVPNKSATDQDLASKSIAQALVARAWCYFNMNMVYGPVYKPGGNNSTRTIPYVTSPDINAPIPDLSTSGEVMTRVFNDLHEALPNLPLTANWPSRANKAAGHAMLAYYHLFTQQYDSVLYYSNLAWNANDGNAAKVIYDYNQFTLTTPAIPTTSPIATPQDNFLNAVNSRETLFYRGSDQSVGLGLSYPSSDIISQFDQANDLRFKFFYVNAPGYKTASGGGYDDGMRIVYYRIYKIKANEGFSYPEVLLMRAEAYARLNRLPQAIADLNTLRTYRYKTGTPPLTFGTQTQDQVIQLVLDERRRELPLGGTKRFLDLKRFVLDTGKPWSKSTITHKVGNQTYTGTVDSKDFIMQILNNFIRFNPQWGIPLDTRPFQ